MLKPRWLGLLGLLLVLLVAFTFLGLWQLNVARDEARKTALADAPRLPVVALTSLLTPHGEYPATASGRRVEAAGRYDAAGQVLVANRRLDGAPGYWVVTPLVVTETGARLAVLRGFVRSPEAALPPTTAGEVTVLGTVAPGESPAASARPLPAGQLASLDLARLVNTWDGPIYNAFLFAISETPDATAAAPAGRAGTEAIERVPPPPVPSGLSLRNAAYALQWWVFGLFAAWMWWRMVRDDHRSDEPHRGQAAPPAALRPNPTGMSRP